MKVFVSVRKWGNVRVLEIITAILILAVCTILEAERELSILVLFHSLLLVWHSDSAKIQVIIIQYFNKSIRYLFKNSEAEKSPHY